ncbi:MAG: hypothetical protein Q8J88_03660 [Bacteroidales bacterium]|nr:hypothetical protein [Bacteroidales bacterium]
MPEFDASFLVDKLIIENNIEPLWKRSHKFLLLIQVKFQNELPVFQNISEME